MLQSLPHSQTHEMHKRLPMLFRAASSSSSSSTERQRSDSSSPLCSDENFLRRAVNYSRTMHAHTAKQLNQSPSSRSSSSNKPNLDPARPQQSQPRLSPVNRDLSAYQIRMHAHMLSQLSSSPSSSSFSFSSPPLVLRSPLARKAKSANETPTRDPPLHTRLPHDVLQKGMSRLGLGDRVVAAADGVDEEVDQDMMAENAVGATPCNTPLRNGEGGVRRIGDVGNGCVGPREVVVVARGGCDGDGMVMMRTMSASAGEPVARDWAVSPPAGRG